MPQVQENVAVEKAVAAAHTVGTSSAELVANNPQRVAVTIYNAGAATVYIDKATATTASSFPVPAGTAFEEREYTGAINAISGSAGQDVRTWETG